MRGVIGVEFGTERPTVVVVLPPCCACRKAPATGVISYAGKVHEPHCEACCKAWELVLALVQAGLLLETPGLGTFREWQADRRKA